jgi:serine/threonine protein kinase
VILVEKKDTKQLFAMKILDKEYIKTKKQVVHTKAERYILENLTHPFILQLHYAFQSDRKLYMITDFMQGGMTVGLPPIES